MIDATKYIREVNAREREKPFELMNSVAEIKGFSSLRIIFDQKKDGVNYHTKKVQEMISQKVEGQM